MALSPRRPLVLAKVARGEAESFATQAKRIAGNHQFMGPGHQGRRPTESRRCIFLAPPFAVTAVGNRSISTMSGIRGLPDSKHNGRKIMSRVSAIKRDLSRHEDSGRGSSTALRHDKRLRRRIECIQPALKCDSGDPIRSAGSGHETWPR